MRSSDEHLHEVIVESVVELALEGPFKLGTVQIARVQVEVVSVNRDAVILELDDDFYAVVFGTRRKIQQRVFIQSQLG